MASVLVLLGSVLLGVAGAVVRLRSPSSAAAPARSARRLTRVGAGLALVALAGWLATVQALTELQQQTVRSGAGWRRTTAAVLVVLALVGIAWFAATFRLLAPSISY